MEKFDKQNRGNGWAPTEEQIYEWLRGQVLCTLSTIDDNGRPDGATVAYSVTTNNELIIGTSSDSRKIHNIDNHPHVAVTVTDSDERYTVQIKGIARIMAQTAFSALADEHYRQRPESLPFRDDPDQSHILIHPEWTRFSDCSVNPWLLTEFEGAKHEG